MHIFVPSRTRERNRKRAEEVEGREGEGERSGRGEARGGRRKEGEGYKNCLGCLSEFLTINLPNHLVRPASMINIL